MTAVLKQDLPVSDLAPAQSAELSAVIQAVAQGFALHQAGRVADAEAIYRRIIAARPDNFDAWHLLGIVAHQRGDHAAAVEHITRALSINPADAVALSNRGNALHALKRHEEALADYDGALAQHPDFDDALCNRGAALHELHRYEEALACCDQTIGRQPDYAEAHSNRGNTLNELRRYDEALASCDRALALRPDFADAHCNRGNALHELKRDAEALASYDRALSLQPGSAKALTNRGVTLQSLRRLDEALASFRCAQAVADNYAEAHYQEAMCLLLTGDFQRGWQQHEWRWKSAQLRSAKRSFAEPLWLGSNEINGKTILLHAEQGFGDTIQFCRYVPLLATRAAHIIVEVQNPLRELMSTLAGGARIVAGGDPLPAFDFHCPLLSLPLALQTASPSIPSATPYLRASLPAAVHWRGRLGTEGRPKIGLAWSGNPEHKNDHNRSIELNALLAALADSGATLVSLQRDVRAGDAALLQGRPDVLHFGTELKSFADTAAIIANLDLVIAVDTGVAHLAGAMAKPVWLLLPFIPDWRWLLDRDDSPWYPTARLFRQDETRAWPHVLAQVRAALHDYLHNS